MEPFHLERYVDEQVFRYNNRATKDNPLDDSDRFLLALSQIANKRLTYAELTGRTKTAIPRRLSNRYVQTPRPEPEDLGLGPRFMRGSFSLVFALALCQIVFRDACYAP